MVYKNKKGKGGGGGAYVGSLLNRQAIPLRLAIRVCRPVYPPPPSLADGTHLLCLLAPRWLMSTWMVPWLPQGRLAIKIPNSGPFTAAVVMETVCFRPLPLMVWAF